MFIEPNIKNRKSGWIEVVCGSMFSGKTEELIRRLKRAQFAHHSVAIFKPATDNRYHETDIVSHDGVRIKSIAVAQANDILSKTQDIDVVGIDEVQFFDNVIVKVAQELALQKTRVICAGLDMDFNKKGFGPMPELLAQADYVTKVHAICSVCGDMANYSYRKTASEETVVLGEKDVYEPRCRTCFERDDKKQGVIF
jgi:thymidine kinase